LEVFYEGYGSAAGFGGSNLITNSDAELIFGWGAARSSYGKCYDWLRDGGDSTTFHTNCDNKGSTVTVAKLSTNYIVGGYTTTDWATTGYSADTSAFLFQLTNGFKLDRCGAGGCSNHERYSASSYWPTFGGGHDLYLHRGSTYCNVGYTFACRVGSYATSTCRNDFCGAYSSLTFSELEVWYENGGSSQGFQNSALITSSYENLLYGFGVPIQPWVRCYSKANDGGTHTAFHSTCDNKGATVVVARLSTGKIVGGYTTTDWVTTGYSADSSAFLFELTGGHKYERCGAGGCNNYERYSASSYGPTFGGGHDLYLHDTSTYCNIGYTFACRVGSYASTTCRNDFCSAYSNMGFDELEVWYGEDCVRHSTSGLTLWDSNYLSTGYPRYKDQNTGVYFVQQSDGTYRITQDGSTSPDC
jgi:hypothetical protein